MKLLIAIPALNEEDSIEAIITRSLEARSHIIEHSFIAAVDVTVVSDGSTDKTVELASKYRDQIHLIIFEKNRGYGAAIQQAWKESDAEIVGFLDADGTCDPKFFADLCKELETKDADVTLGCRINPKSKMPLIRRVGNIIYALLLTVFSSTRVKDTASGMRVVKRSSLGKIFPLPDGLHFTPAMSARAILSNDVKICEIDMPYEERAGESKLSVWKDGIRFLRVIFESAWTYCPSRLFDVTALGCLLYVVFIMITPIIFYIQNGKLEEWMIYRFIVANLGALAACLLICVGHLSRKIVEIAFSIKPWSAKQRGILSGYFKGKLFWPSVAFLLIVGGAFVFESFLDLVMTGHTDEHWSRFVAMSSFYSIAIVLLITRALIYSLDLIAARLTFLRAPKNSQE